MKKCIVLLAAVMAVSVASADIGVTWTSGSNAYPQYSDTSYLGASDQILVQLIWSASGPTTADVNNADYLGAGEFLLTDQITTVGGYGTYLNATAALYANGDVGGNNIDAGVIFVRMWDASALAPTALYTDANTLAVIPGYIAGGPPSTVTQYDSTAVGSGTGSLVMNTTPIPEPGTIMLGLLGVGTLIARRMKKRS